MQPNTKATTSDMTSAAQILAHFIDAVAGDWPLVSVMPQHLGNALLWQYGKHWFVVHFEALTKKYPSEAEFKLGSPTDIYVPSLDAALELIRTTESLRQQNPFPLIRLGLMPGTAIRPETP